MSINRVMVSGNLTRDPELRQTQSGMSVMSFGIAVNDRRKNPQTDAWEDYPNFLDCTLFGARADALSKYLYKGVKVAIEGKLRWSQWERDGQKRSKVEIIVDNLEFMTSKNGQGAPTGQTTQPAPAAAPATAPANSSVAAPIGGGDGFQPPIDVNADAYDEEIPF